MNVSDASLAEETRKRYLSYALSVITSRALPDVRDGLKPVQRRILYAMQHDLRLRPEGRYVKSARVVGEVIGKYHPHGDTAVYDALARMAQDFTMRAQLVDGRGNFGSPDGDSPAAMRYTECKLAPMSTELLSELGQDTVVFRPTYDGQLEEPLVVPARYPNLLVNGSQGIAVGMATSIPPHNLGEVIDAAVALIDDPEMTTTKIMVHLKGPDFPTGGQVVSTKVELRQIYDVGHGSVKLRGEWKLEKPKKKRENPRIVITSIPYAVVRSTVVEKVAEVIIGKKLPHLLDVRDESTEETRVVLEIKKGADPQLVMAYLYKHTPLQTNVTVNLTCLVPTEQEDVAAPQRLSVGEMLHHFLDFRMEVVTRRIEHALRKLLDRIHILEGFVLIFDALDETIRIIRRSDGKADAAKKLIRRFELSDRQADAILELRLHRLAKLAILEIREELEEKRAEAERLEQLLSSKDARWKLIRAELLQLKTDYGDRRQTKISGSVAEPEYDAEAFIVDEDQIVLLTQQGWVKRQGRVTDVSSTRTRDGDAVMDVTAGSTRESVAFFSNFGSCYVCRIVDIPATTGYGDPVHTLFKLKDGERIVKMLGFDPRLLEVPEPTEDAEEPEEPWALAVTRGGMTTRFSLRVHRDPSTRNGRRYMRLNKGDEVLMVGLSDGEMKVACATKKGHALLTTDDEVPVLGGPGKGVKLIKLGKGDEVVGARIMEDSTEPLVVENDKGKQFEITVWRTVVSRGGKGGQLFKRGTLVREIPVEPEVPELNGE
ncbi:MAG TPA: DNA topoisomerase IV subunit A [Sandaracinaceae bacterium LLY-WYZ-13_1]|nr:DNA topoisomerase IV subunit A [Sandaracinaceae bacterium LLY-WYZ-13_1]